MSGCAVPLYFQGHRVFLSVMPVNGFRLSRFDRIDTDTQANAYGGSQRITPECKTSRKETLNSTCFGWCDEVFPGCAGDLLPFARSKFPHSRWPNMRNIFSCLGLLRGRRHLSAFCFKRTMFVWKGGGLELFRLKKNRLFWQSMR